MLLGPAKNFQDRMAYLAKTVPDNNGRLLPSLPAWLSSLTLM